MNEYMETLIKNPLFEGITDSEDISGILTRLNAQVKHYDKGTAIITEQFEINSIGIILEGEAQAVKLDLSGKCFILAHLSAGSIFGYVLSVSRKRKSPVTVIAAGEVTALIIPVNDIINGSLTPFGSYARLLSNLLNIISEKYFELHDRINCIIKPTLREKILFYLNNESYRSGSKIFDIPFDRAALAEYLNAERSAVSRELSAMKKDGVIDYYKNSFKLY